MVTPMPTPTSASLGASAPDAIRATATSVTSAATTHLPVLRQRPSGTSVYRIPTSKAAKKVTGTDGNAQPPQLTPILAQRIRPQSGMLAGWSVELEAEGASAPPRDFDVGEVGLAEHRGVGAPVEPYDDGVLVVGDDDGGGLTAKTPDDELADGARVGGQGGLLVDDLGTAVGAVAVQPHGPPRGGGQRLDVAHKGW